MKNFLTIALFSFILCFLPGVAQQNPADAPATKADIEKYLEVMHAREMMIKTVDAMTEPMHRMIHEQFLKSKNSLPADFEGRMNKMMDDMLHDMPWDEVLQSMVPVYQKHLTKGDVDALVTFYSSPTGQKVLHDMPAIMADAMQVSMPIIRDHVEKMTERLQEEAIAMSKESQKPAPPSASPK